MQDRSCAMVVGMHRSGTSCTAGILAQLGYVAPENMIGANKSNPKGHWEAESVARFNDRILMFAGTKWRSWDALNRNWINTPYFDRFVEEGRAVLSEAFADAPMIVLKDPRLCRLASVWHEILGLSGFETTVFMPLRHPAEVSASLGTRNSIDAAQGQYLWLRYMLDAESGTRGRRRFLFRYSNLVSDWRETLRQAEVAIGAVFPRLNDTTAASIDAFVDQTLYRNRSTSLEEGGMLHPLVEELYEILAGWADGGERADDYSRIDEIDEIFSEFAKEVRPLFLVFDSVQDRLKEMHASLVQQNAGLAEMRSQAEDGGATDPAVSPDLIKTISAQSDEIGGLQGTLKQMTRELVDDESGLRANLAKLFSAAQSDKIAAVAGARMAKEESNDKIAALTDELAVMREASETATKQMTKLQETIESLRHHDAQATADAKQAHENMSELESRISALTSELEQKRAEIDHVYAERDGIAKQMELLDLDVEGARERELGLEKKLQRSNDELIASLDEIVSLANLLRNEEQKILKIQTDLEAEKKTGRVLEKQLEAQRLNAAALQQQVAKLREDLANAVSDRRAVSDKKRVADAKLIALRERYATGQAKADLLEQGLRAQSARSGELETEKSVANLKLKTLRSKHEAMLAKQSRLLDENKQIDIRARSLMCHAESISRILAEMNEKQVIFPSMNNRRGVLGFLLGSRQRRWKQFCDSLAEQKIFDANVYLTLHPDVAGSGMDPLVHYLSRGHLECRDLLPSGVEQAGDRTKNGQQTEDNR